MAQYTIQSVDITVENKGKNTWNIANVKYDSKGESKTKKVVSFKNPEVFNTVKALKEGDVVEVSFTPGDEYYNWSGVKVLGGQAAKETPAASAAPTGGRAPTSNYETKEERALRQVMIVKQSSLAQSVALLKDVAGIQVEAILDTAQTFADWVLEKPDLFKQDNDLGDVPF
jgi:hypothetical protein